MLVHCQLLFIICAFQGVPFLQPSPCSLPSTASTEEASALPSNNKWNLHAKKPQPPRRTTCASYMQRSLSPPFKQHVQPTCKRASELLSNNNCNLHAGQEARQVHICLRARWACLPRSHHWSKSMWKLHPSLVQWRGLCTSQADQVEHPDHIP